MVRRTYWLSAIEALWREKSIVWLSGVRRAGKTFLCQSLPDSEYLDCELPSTRRAIEDPEQFLRDLGPRRLVLDEIHRLADRDYGGVRVRFLNLPELMQRLLAG